MALQPKPSDAPQIRSALKLYRVTSIITGTFLLLLCLVVVFRILGVDIEMGGAFGFLFLRPKEQITAVNLSTAILIAHGWFYVLYLFSDFRMWSLMRWSFLRFIIIALGGVVPFLSFIVERRYHRIATKEFDAILEKAEAESTTEAAH